jgi:hypothetical protein
MMHVHAASNTSLSELYLTRCREERRFKFCLCTSCEGGALAAGAATSALAEEVVLLFLPRFAIVTRVTRAQLSDK